ncbi:MAG: hypothetical protein H6841_03865 [Planctomycetes bacterium]|nr:hypothetical protein [Planctomycetota bacterium]MCB9934512.1 hypothetical protein [Planctomycetota bacterium]
MKFDARVLGVPNHLAAAKQYLSKQDFALETAKMRAAETRLVEKLPDQKREIQDMFKRKLEPISHFQCERFNFLQPLHEFACFVDGTTPEEVIEENAWTNSLHLVLMGQNDAIVVPFDFSVPLQAEVEGRAHPYVICSGLRIVKELDSLDEYVAVEHTLGVKEFGAFVNLSRKDMSKFEKEEGVGRRFWAKWGVAAMRGLVTRSNRAGVPVFVDPQFGEVPLTV